jgi:hypothetical protein
MIFDYFGRDGFGLAESICQTALFYLLKLAVSENSINTGERRHFSAKKPGL